MEKIYKVEDLKPTVKMMLFANPESLKDITRKDLTKEKFKYCYTLKYKGTKVYFEHNNTKIELL
jgi:hypothetical protein